MYSNVSSRKVRVHTNLKRTTGKLKITRDAVKTLESEREDRRGSKKASFRSYDDDSSNVVYSDGFLRRKEKDKGVRGLGFGVKDKSQNYKSHKRDYQKEERNFESRNLVSLDRKRKRVYDGPETGNEKHSYGEERRELRNVSGKEMRITKGKSFGLYQPKNSKPFEAGTRSNDKYSSNMAASKLRTKVKVDDKFERFSYKTSEKKSGYGKFDNSKGIDFKSNKQAAESVGKYSMRNMKVKKKSVVDSTEDFRPRKKKKLMRIDRHDISNKRIDDSIVNEGNTNKGKKDAEETAQMSKNAQFRAIIPSPSILSFVEDNLLGRRRLNDIRKAGYNREISAPLDNIPSSTSLERERIEDPIFRNKLDFFAAAKVSSSFPPPNLPEVAFAGRSNVGKSSLLNALTRQWGVVRTSDKPGLTQTINFFNLGTKLCLVDLPGYGFAYAKDEVKESWEELVKEYVSTRVGLKRVCLLIDTKWGMKHRDYELIDLMERYKTKYQIVLTKTDAVFPIDVARRATQIEETLKKNTSVVQPAVMVSSKSGAGIRSLRAALTKITRFAKL